jgi:hypothetical protein
LYGHGEIRIQDAISAYNAAQSGPQGISNLQAGDLMISEVMHNPEMVVDYRGEWIEIYNNSGAELNLNGLQIGNGVESGVTVGQDLIVADGGYVVLGVYASSVGNGGYSPDYVYSYGNLRLRKNTTLTLSNGSTTVDTFSYSSSTHDTTAGSALSLNSLNPNDADSASNWCASTSSYGDGDLGTPGASNDVCINSTPLNSLNVGDLIISEVMVDPGSVSDFRGEWFEIYNNAGSIVDIDGLTVGCGGNAGFTVSGSTFINDGDSVLFAVRSNTSTNGGLTNVDVEYVYSTCSFSYNDSLSVGFGSTTFDSVSWTSAFPFSSGNSMSLGTLNAAANDSAGNWCAGSSTYGDGDVGTPGSSNDSCPLSTPLSSLSAGDLVISEVMVDFLAVSDFRGEWFEVYNNTADTVELNGLVVGCGGNNGFTFGGYIQVNSGEEALFAVNTNSSSNGGLPSVDGTYAYSTCAFTYNDSLSIGFSSTTFDSLTWTNSFPFTSGSSMNLGTLDATSNDSAVNWCEASSSYGSGDLGTPGDVNDNCPNPAMSSSSLGSGDLIITEIMTNPVTVFDYRGEWFEIYNNSGFNVNLNGLNINSSNNSGFTIGDDFVVANGDHTLFAVNSGSSVNGGLPAVDYVYGYNTLSFGRQDDITLSVSGTQIDSVTYNGSYPAGVGASLTLSVLSATANDSVSNWCEASSSYGSGENGTPGSANDNCP